MSQLFRIFIAILTFIATLGLLGCAFYALSIPHVGMFVICLIMAGGFGFFTARDIKYFFEQK